jgi:hypothetical protein
VTIQAMTVVRRGDHQDAEPARPPRPPTQE